MWNEEFALRAARRGVRLMCRNLLRFAPRCSSVRTGRSSLRRLSVNLQPRRRTLRRFPSSRPLFPPGTLSASPLCPQFSRTNQGPLEEIIMHDLDVTQPRYQYEAESYEAETYEGAFNEVDEME